MRGPARGYPPPVDVAPDYLEPLRGWRLWELAGGRDDLRLRSLVRRDCRWPVGGPLVADCPSGRLPGPPERHEAPEASCWCGIHAFSDEGTALRTMADLGQELDGPVVVGTVLLWGAVVQCAEGLRGQFAYPGELWVPHLAGRPRGRPVAERLAAGLARYRVPVHTLPLESWADPPARVPRGDRAPLPPGG